VSTWKKRIRICITADIALVGVSRIGGRNALFIPPNLLGFPDCLRSPKLLSELADFVLCVVDLSAGILPQPSVNAVQLRGPAQCVLHDSPNSLLVAQLGSNLFELGAEIRGSVELSLPQVLDVDELLADGCPILVSEVVLGVFELGLQALLHHFLSARFSVVKGFEMRRIF